MANILPVDMLYYKSISILMHDINCKTTSKLLDLFTRADSVFITLDLHQLVDST